MRQELGIQSYNVDNTLLAEHVLEPEGYSIDLYMPGYRMCIEADGPHHWCVYN